VMRPRLCAEVGEGSLPPPVIARMVGGIIDDRRRLLDDGLLFLPQRIDLALNPVLSILLFLQELLLFLLHLAFLLLPLAFRFFVTGLLILLSDFGFQVLNLSPSFALAKLLLLQIELSQLDFRFQFLDFLLGFGEGGAVFELPAFYERRHNQQEQQERAGGN